MLEKSKEHKSLLLTVANQLRIFQLIDKGDVEGKAIDVLINL
jgi:hypothetical protein